MAILNKQRIATCDYFLSLRCVLQHVHYQN